MKRDRIINAGSSLLLSITFLTACGGRNTQTATSSEPTEATPIQIETTSEAEIASSSEPSEAALDGDPGTVINPPKAATLTAEQADAQINLRSQPTTTSESKGYGLVGDPVRLLRANEGQGGLTWYFVKFDKSGAEGWIRGDFIDTSGGSANQSANNINIDSYTRDELFAVDGGGCGMSLWPVNNPGDFIFFNGLPDTEMWMKLDGEMTAFRRTSASGPEFYGQSATQTFVSDDGQIEVNVTASVGSEEGYESVNIQQGKLILEDPSGRKTEIAVVGDAGC